MKKVRLQVKWLLMRDVSKLSGGARVVADGCGHRDTRMEMWVVM